MKTEPKADPIIRNKLERMLKQKENVFFCPVGGVLTLRVSLNLMSAAHTDQKDQSPIK